LTQQDQDENEPMGVSDMSRRISVSSRAGIATFVSALLAACVSSETPSSQTDTAFAGIVQTSSGPVRGKQGAGVDRFLGIPYAAPPVGALRWRPPEPPLAASSTLDATHFAPTCAQTARGAFASPSQSEDCLYLNIFAPHAARSETRHPVMVWIYGGGLFSGESNDYDASRLVQAGTVVITFNYRIGALGFFSQPAINAEGHAYANYGLMDQQAALRWVKSNIGMFGGDPDNVTIFGQSGGGTSVLAQLASPTASGLFERAIIQSGTRIEPYTPDAALSAGKALAAAAGCTDQSAHCLRALSTTQILQHQARIAQYIGTSYPVIDGQIVTQNPQQAFERGTFNRVPIVNGLVEDEQAFFLPEILAGTAPLDANGYKRFLNSFGPAHVAALSAIYPLASNTSPSEAEISAVQDEKICIARYLDRDWSRYVKVYAYQFDDRTAPSYFPPTSYPMRAYHTAELQYLFPRFHGGGGTPHSLDPAQEALSNQMIAYWASFAASGVPITASATWPAYRSVEDNVQHLDTTGLRSIPAYGAGHHCDLWDTITLKAGS
jgi:para-nitrobenzyl esterase